MNKMKFINLTGHTITIRHNGLVIKIPPSGREFRLKQREQTIDIINGVYLIHQYYSNLGDIPRPRPGVIYITSWKAMRAIRRADVVAPGGKLTGRRGGRNVVGCTDLVCCVFDE